MYITERDFYFSASHYLPEHEKCGKMHGHNWKVTVRVQGEVNERGMTIDFAQMKRIIKPIIDYRFDHKCINDELTHPTAENIGRRIFELLRKYLNIHSITVEETRDCRVTYTGEEREEREGK